MEGMANMSVVIVGGNECMERQYKQICRELGHKAKVFLKPCAAMRGNFGNPDLIILFTSTVSHTMVRCALCGMKGSCPRVERSHSSSAAALKEILSRYQTA